MILHRTAIRLAVLLLFFAATVPAVAQRSVQLSGRITDSGGKPVAYALVAAPDLTPVPASRTDANGRYTLPLPNDSAIHIAIRIAGKAPLDTVLNLIGVNNLTFSPVLLDQATQLGPVTVTEGRTRQTSFTHISVERIEHAVGPQAGVESLLKTLPDVSSNNELSTQYSVRGGSFDENLVYINGIEVYRPLLIRTGQQEGASLINPDMVDHILFSPGGFDATYGDRMSSVLDITYARPTTFRGHASLSFLGASLHLEDAVGERFAYSLGLRSQSNRYLFRSLDTKGNYTTNYLDLQALLSYRFSDRLDASALLIASRNVYGLVPSESSVAFGSFQESLQLTVYYEGQERDRYTTALGALSFNYHPTDELNIRWITSFQANNEAELYDILSQYRLDEVNTGVFDEDGNPQAFVRGVGSFLEHARNYLQTNIISTELRGTHYARLGNWNWGLKLQHEQVRDRMREWKWVDSAGYTLPSYLPGFPSDTLQPPLLQLFCRSDHPVATSRLSAFVQRNIDYYNSREDLFSLVVGARLQWYAIDFSDDSASGVSNYALAHNFDTLSPYNRHLLFSPRISLNFKPNQQRDMLFRLAAGVYSQAPFYREYRADDGVLNHAIRPQNSYQTMATFDWNFRVANSPFKFTADLYYKYITNLIPYRIDNLRVRYDAHNEAVGYAAGLSLRLSGEVVEGLESWASLSFMKTQEDILGDAYGWLARPTDQRVSFKLFFQDYIPTIPFWRMSLNFIVASGLPYTRPFQQDFSKTYYYKPYFRVDWGNTLQLSRFDRVKHSRLMRHLDDILLTLEVFNLFNFNNIVSYIWVADYSNQYYAVPNYLTARQLNLKVAVTF